MVLVVAGFDPSGGAGILQDVKVLTLLGVKSNAVISALTVQNTRSVFSVKFRDWEEMREEIAVLDRPKVIKVGLARPEVVKKLKETFPDAVLVWNVVLKSSSGFSFLDPKGVDRYTDWADYVVLNSEEAKDLTVKDNFVITGGHEDGEKIRVRYRDLVFEEDRVAGRFHGTGCAFSSMVAGFLDYGYPIEEAIRASMGLMRKVLERSSNEVETEKLARDWFKHDVLETLNGVLPEYLEVSHLTVPEVGQNVSYALPWAKTEEEVGKFPGRIRLKEGKGVVVSCASFRDKSHTARMTIEMMKHFPYLRCTVNVRYQPEYVERAKAKGLKVYRHDRSQEPREVSEREGESLRWMVRKAVEALGIAPDIIYDEGWWGKEAMIRVFGRDPKDVLRKIRLMLEG